MLHTRGESGIDVPEDVHGSELSEADGNPVHLLRHPHGERGAAGGHDRAESTAGGLLKRKHAHGKVLSQGNYASVIDNGQKNPAETTGMRYKNVNLVTRTQKWMGPVGCFGQNKKRQSLNDPVQQ